MCNIYMLINKHHKLYTILSITQIKQYKILFQRNYTIDQNQLPTYTCTLYTFIMINLLRICINVCFIYDKEVLLHFEMYLLHFALRFCTCMRH